MNTINHPFQVCVPCSTANLGPGFDSIGMALDRFLRLTFSPAEERHITLSERSEEVALDDNNLIMQVIQKAFAEQKQALPTFHMHMDNQIPLARGLGSSATAIVAGYVAANQLLGQPWNQDEIFQRVTAWEGHPDNVGASLLGGIVIGSWDGKRAEYIPCEPPDLPILAVIPDQSLLTKKARSVLPDTYARPDMVLTSSRANLLTAALFSQRWDLLATAMQDGFHQPYRLDLVPGLKEAVSEATKHGAWGIALSGAGPTMIAFVREMDALKKYFQLLFDRLNIPMEMVLLHPVKEGAKVQLTVKEECSKFVANMIGA